MKSSQREQVTTMVLLGLVGIACSSSGSEGTTESPSTSSGGSSAATDSSSASTNTSTGNMATGSGGSQGGSSGTGGALEPTGSASGGNGGSGPDQNVGTSGVSLTPRSCDDPDKGLPAGAPQLEVGKWVDISPPGLAKQNPEQMIGQGITMDPCDPATLYWGNTPYDVAYGGAFKTTNAGGDWVKLGDPNADSDPWDNETTYLLMPLHFEIDPADQSHVYANDGVRGNLLGFWESFDGGNTWTKPAGFTKVGEDNGIFVDDVYDIAVDPTDFDHVLVSFHGAWDWDSAAYGQSSGVLETRDGGDSWIVHPPPDTSISSGHAINFLFNPELGLGDSGTWLLGTQTGGQWRTSDWGENWTKVSDVTIEHGGGTTYYTADGVLYVAGRPGLRSMDNGVSFEDINAGSSLCIFGDGETLYTGAVYGEVGIDTSPENDGMTWTKAEDIATDGGPYSMVFDKVNRIVYASRWSQGVWALKLPD